MIKPVLYILGPKKKQSTDFLQARGILSSYKMISAPPFALNVVTPSVVSRSEMVSCWLQVKEAWVREVKSFYERHTAN